MFSVKNKYILAFITMLWVYLAFRLNNNNSVYCESDIIIVLLFMIGGWFICFNHRLFTMTRKRLSKYFFECELEYKSYVKDGLVEQIFVKTKNSEDWYELDYLLTINKGCNVHQYNEFVMRNGTVRRLLKTMNAATDNPLISKEYELYKTEYNSVRWLMLFVVILSLFIFTLVKYSNNYYF